MDFGLISPELALLVIALTLVVIDLILPADRKAMLPYLTAASLLIPAALVLVVSQRRQTSFFETFIVDEPATVFKLIFLLAAIVVALISASYVRDRAISPGEYYALLVASTLGMFMMASGNELVTLYIGLELTSISLYLLAGLHKTDKLSTEAGMKYLVLGAVSSATLLYGMALIYGTTGTTVLPEIAARLTEVTPVVALAVILITAGLGFKIAAVPFHMWVPDVYHGAPTPVAAFLSVASKAAGFVIVLRIFAIGLAPLDDFWPTVFAALAAVTMTLGNLAALNQTNIKRLMGYSSIAQAGFALMALSAAGSQTTSALIFFLVVYAFTNLGAFACIIYFSNRLVSDEISSYAGLARRAMAPALVLAFCLISLVGMPPAAGFWAKVYLFYSVFQSDLLWLVLVGLLNTAISVYYYLKIVHAMFLRPPADETPLKGEFAMGLVMATAVAGLALLFVAPSLLTNVSDAAAGALMR